MALTICLKFLTTKLIEGKLFKNLKKKKKKKKEIPATSLLFVEEHDCDT